MAIQAKHKETGDILTISEELYKQDPSKWVKSGAKQDKQPIKNKMDQPVSKDK